MDLKYHIETAFRHTINHILPLLLLTLVFILVSTLTLGLFAPAALAGYTDSLMKLFKFNRAPEIKDILSQSRLFLPLLLFSFVVMLISFTGLKLMVIPGLIFPLIIGYIGLYMIPIMVDREFGLLDAFKKSMSIVTRSNIIDHITVFILFTALSTIGYASFIGFLFLQPFATLFLLSVYDKAD